MPAEPEINILLPVKNAAVTLQECLQSIANQTRGEFEVIAVNDGSSDATADILHDWWLRDRRFRYIDNPGHGLVDTLNHGLDHCNCDLVARMDGDDIMYPGRLAAHLQHFYNRADLALSATQVRLFPEEEIQAGYCEYIRWQNQLVSADDINNDIYLESPLAHPSVCLRRSVISQLGGYRQGDFPEDYDLWLRMAHAGFKMEKIPQVLMDWRESDDRTSRVDPRYSRTAFDRLRAHYLARDPRLTAAGKNLVIWGAGRKTRRRADHLIDHGYQPMAWIDIDPRKIGNRLNGIPVVGPEWLQREDKPLVLVYVANHGARELIAGDLELSGYQRGRDYLMVG